MAGPLIEIEIGEEIKHGDGKEGWPQKGTLVTWEIYFNLLPLRNG